MEKTGFFDEQITPESPWAKVLVGRICWGLGLVSLALTLTVTDPIDWAKKYMLRVSENSTLFNSLRSPDYVIHESVYVFNYTNTERFMQGLDDRLKVEEVGPFVFREISEGLNMSVDEENNVLRITPNARLEFIPELSVGRMEDVRVVAPNLVMIVLGTLGADKLPWWSNSLVEYLMKSQGAKPFMEISVKSLLWGYKDPLVDFARKYFPGWIDFDIVGVLRLFYSAKLKELELNLNPETMFSIKNMEGSPGLKEQGYDGNETATYCNYIRGAFPGMMVTPSFPKDQTLGVFKYQGCRVYPFVYESEGVKDINVPYYRFKMAENAWNSTGEYSCGCGHHCPPDGLADISSCYYGFPAYLSPPHFYHGDPSLFQSLEGLSPNAERARTYVDFDPVTGVPLGIHTSSQTNLRVHVSPHNSAMKPFRTAKYLPVIWLTLTTPFGPPDTAVLRLRLLHVHAPRILFVSILIAMLLGVWLVINGTFVSARNILHRRQTVRDKDTSREPLNNIKYA